MTSVVGVVAGALLALALVRVARRRGPASADRVYAVGLLLAALVYVAFALAGRAGGRWLALESLGVALYGALAWLGARRWRAALALGWAAHVAWDVGLHLAGAGAAFTPAWYPWLCVGFDVAVAAAALGPAVPVARAAAVAAAGVALALASSAVAGTRLEVQDWDCPPAPQSCARPVEVRGFPRAYVSDYHGISPVGRASLVSALLGEDLFRPRDFWLDAALYAAVVGAAWGAAWGAARRAARR